MKTEYLETKHQVFSCCSANDRSDGKTDIAIEQDGTVLALDPVSGNWTTCHDITIDILCKIQADVTRSLRYHSTLDTDATPREIEYAAQQYTRALRRQRALDAAIRALTKMQVAS